MFVFNPHTVVNFTDNKLLTEEISEQSSEKLLPKSKGDKFRNIKAEPIELSDLDEEPK